MKRTPIVLFGAVLLFAACGQKKIESAALDAPVQPIQHDQPLIEGRNLDSLAAMPYEPRLLAFSIELGHRSADFNKRLGLMIASITPDATWKEVVEFRTSAENYRSARRHNIGYLDSLEALVANPPARFKSYQTGLSASFERLKANYNVLDRYDRFPTMSAILDTVLANEIFINRSLNEFRSFLENPPGFP
jgi:hypothetical protein